MKFRTLLFGVTIKTLLLLTLLLYSSLAIDSDINFAPGINPEDLKRIHPKLRDMTAYIAVFCKENNIKFVITSAIRSEQRNRELNSVSQTHVEGRAIDFSIKEQWGWNSEKLMIITDKLQKIYGQYGAFTKSINNKQVLVYTHENGNGFHVHLQVYKGLPR